MFSDFSPSQSLGIVENAMLLFYFSKLKYSFVEVVFPSLRVRYNVLELTKKY